MVREQSQQSGEWAQAGREEDEERKFFLRVDADFMESCEKSNNNVGTQYSKHINDSSIGMN